MKDHPIAGLFPLLPPLELTELAESIQRSGQRDTIVLFEGQILDGRNRFRACEQVGIKPRTRIFDPKADGTSPLRFVMDLNLSRRHLSVSQRAAIAAEALKLREAMAKALTDSAATPAPLKAYDPDEAADEADDAPEALVVDGSKPEAMEAAADPDDDLTDDDKPTVAEAAAQMGVSKRSVEHAKSLTPEHLEEVKQGTKSLHAAKQEEATAALKEQRKEAVAKVAKVCGKDFAEAMARNTVLKTVKELAAFLALDPEQMKAVQPLISTGWKVAKALAHALNNLNGESTIADLINKAIASGGDEFTVVVNGWEISAINVGASHDTDGKPAKKWQPGDPAPKGPDAPAKPTKSATGTLAKALEHAKQAKKNAKKAPKPKAPLGDG